MVDVRSGIVIEFSCFSFVFVHFYISFWVFSIGVVGILFWGDIFRGLFWF